MEPLPPQAETVPFPLITLEGPAKERGRQYGQQAGERIAVCLAIYRAAIDAKGVEWEKARAVARRIQERLEKSHPEQMAEMCGIAEGLGEPVEDIVAINARTELLYGLSKAAVAKSEPDGCTGAIALPSVTADGHLLHGQNWDWRDECADCGVVLRIIPEKGPRILTFVEAGMMARAGLNSAGVAITGNFLECEKDGSRDGVPIPLIRRAVLSQTHLSDALLTVLQSPRAFSNNLMVSHADGDAIDLETTPDEAFWIAPEGGLLVHANHFVSAAARAKLQDRSLLVNADSLYRDRRVEAHLRAAAGSITLETLKEAFQDRWGAPRAVCRSVVSGPGGRTSSTVATILMDVTARRMWVAPRPYGPHSYAHYDLD